MNTEDSTPWYKQFWPWFIFSIPGLTVVAGISMIFSASENPDGMVVDDYYKTGLAINQTLARDKHAEELGLQAIGRVDKANKQIRLTLYGQNTEQSLNLTLTHPTSEKYDIRIELRAAKGSREFIGQLPALPHEKRYILLEPADKNWRLTGHALFPEMIQWSLRPGL